MFPVLAVQEQSPCTYVTVTAVNVNPVASNGMGAARFASGPWNTATHPPGVNSSTMAVLPVNRATCG